MVLAQDLREAVLQAALQGKLTEQFETDSSVDVLLQGIKLEKKKLIDKGEIKREKMSSSIDKEDIPFRIPSTWKWSRMQDILDVRDGTHDSPTYQISGVPFITSKNLVDGKIDFDNVKCISQEDADIFNKRSKVNKGDILMAMIGSIGKPVLVDSDKEFAIKNVALLKKVPNTDLNMKYVLLLLYYSEAIMKNQSLGGVQKFVSLTYLRKYIVPLPPIEEQQRIVDRVNELMERIDEYEKVEKELIALEQRFPDDMKNALLQAAMQGRLTEQLDSDSSVDEMLDDVETIKKGNINVEFEEDFLREIPDNWRYVRLGDLLFIARGGSPRPIQAYLTEDTEGINWIKIGDTEINGKYICSTKEKIIKDGIKKSRFVKEGDFLLTNSMSFGRPYILKTDGCIHDGWLVLSDENKCFEQDYLYWLLSSPLVFIQFSGMAAGAVVKNLNIDKVKSTIIPLPPIEEQRRIVERLEQLLPLCETE